MTPHTFVGNRKTGEPLTCTACGVATGSYAALKPCGAVRPVDLQRRPLLTMAKPRISLMPLPGAAVDAAVAALEGTGPQRCRCGRGGTVWTGTRYGCFQCAVAAAKERR